MEKKRMRSMTAITLRLATLVLGIWLLCISLLTLGTALYVYQDVQEQGRELAELAGKLSQLDSYYDVFQEGLPTVKAIPGFLDHGMLQSVEKAYVKAGSPSLWTGKGNSWSIYDSRTADCPVSVAFVDSEGQVLHKSGDFLSFEYVTEATWLSGEESPLEGYAWLDLGNPTDQRYQLLRNSYDGTGDLYNICALRLTGTFDGSRFEPYAMAVMNDSAFSQAVERWREDTAYQVPPAETSSLEESGTGEENTTSASGESSASTEETPSFTYGQLDSQGYVEWHQLFDHTAQAGPDTELVTIYGTRPTMMVYDEGSQVDYQGITYPSLLELLLSRVPDSQGPAYDFYSASDQENLWNVVIFSARSFTDLTGYDPSDPESSIPEPDFTLIVAVHASPLKIAMGFLWKVYLITGLVALAGFLLVRGSVKKHLLRPLEEVNQSMAANWSRLPTLEISPPKWRELWLLSQQYADMQDRLRIAKNEVTRLNTALNYARTAEENRRQMISHLTHQLKTPLAVIHGYAEGLREHIAEEKRDHYVEMILSETERSDKMVLEMLDLSRLEAGKVKLSRDQVSLLALTQYMVEKLEKPIAEKQLQVKFLTQEEGLITADESRMAQVMENFFTNAVKYTPKGGWIQVELERGRREITFTLKNQSQPLSQEELRQVWDPFYRAKDAQMEEGTGLGLAIVKTIIELHGGDCFAWNIDQGVSFGFKIPQ